MIKFKIDLDSKNEGFLNLLEDDKRVGFMDIKVKDSLLTVFHTEVLPEEQGKGYAGKLFNQLLDYAKKNNLQIVALCPYALTRFKKNPEIYKGIWKRD